MDLIKHPFAILGFAIFIFSNSASALGVKVSCESKISDFSFEEAERKRERGLNVEVALREITHLVEGNYEFKRDCAKWFSEKYRKRFEAIKVPVEKSWSPEEESSCPTVEPIDEATKNSFGQQDNKNQTAWCAAYVVGKLASQRTLKPLSVIDIGVRSIGKDKRSAVDDYLYQRAVDPEEAVEAISGKAICSEERLPSNNRGGRVFNEIDKLAKIDQAGFAKRRAEALKDCNDKSPFQEVYRSLRLTKEISDVLKTQNREGKVVKVVTEFCKDPQNTIQVPELQLQTRIKRFCSFRNSFSSGDNSPYRCGDYTEELDQQLNNKKMLGVAINLEVLNETYGPAFKGKLQGFESRINGVPTGHVLTVVGRKYNPESKQCEYLLRNSIATNSRTHPSFIVPGDNTLLRMPRKTLTANSSEYFYLK